MNNTKINKFREALKAIEGYIDTMVVEERGLTHIVLATTQDPASIVNYTTPSRPAIEKFAERVGLRVMVMPFADAQNRGVCYDIIIRPTAR